MLDGSCHDFFRTEWRSIGRKSKATEPSKESIEAEPTTRGKRNRSLIEPSSRMVFIHKPLPLSASGRPRYRRISARTSIPWLTLRSLMRMEWNIRRISAHNILNRRILAGESWCDTDLDDKHHYSGKHESYARQFRKLVDFAKRIPNKSQNQVRWRGDVRSGKKFFWNSKFVGIQNSRKRCA